MYRAPERAARKTHPRIPSRPVSPPSPSFANGYAATDRHGDNLAVPQTLHSGRHSTPAPRPLPDTSELPARAPVAAGSVWAESTRFAEAQSCSWTDTNRADRRTQLLLPRNAKSRAVTESVPDVPSLPDPEASGLRRLPLHVPGEMAYL